VHPDLTNLEQFYIRTRADVTAGKLHGQEGIARVQANTITDATGRIWAVDPMSPDPNHAMFKAAVPGQTPMSADPSTYQPMSNLPQGGFSSDQGDFAAGYPVTFPVDVEEKKSRFKRDKSKGGVSAGSQLEKLKALPRWVWLAGALFVVLLMVAMQLLGSAPATTTTTSVQNTISTNTTVPATVATTVPTGPVAAPGELSALRVTNLIASLESLDATKAQTAVVNKIDTAAYATFITRFQAGERLSIVGEPTEIAGAPAASVTLHRTDASGAEISSATMMMVKDAVTGEWMLRELPAL
jgi:hypothetical protein